MKNATFDNFLNIIEEMGRALTRAMRMSLRALATMSWPTLLVTCILMAMALTVIPLVIFLFVVFTCLKLIIASFVIEKRRGKATPYTDVDSKGE